VRRFPVTDEYSQDRMHQKKAKVSKSAMVDDSVEDVRSCLAWRWISL